MSAMVLVAVSDGGATKADAFTLTSYSVPSVDWSWPGSPGRILLRIW